MNIETTTIRGDVSDYLKFGWKHTEDQKGRSGPHHYTMHILARDKDMPNYRLVAALESKYFSLKSQLKTYQPMDVGLSIILFLLLIFPFVVYVVFKSSQKKKIEENNSRIRSQMNAVLKEVYTLL